MLLAVGYAIAGWLLFSSQLNSFMTLSDSLTTVLSMCMLGETDLGSMEAANPVIAKVRGQINVG